MTDKEERDAIVQPQVSGRYCFTYCGPDKCDCGAIEPSIGIHALILNSMERDFEKVERLEHHKGNDDE